MMNTRKHVPYYHISNTSSPGLTLFRREADYERFIQLLYTANSRTPLRSSPKLAHNIFMTAREEPLVDIVAYCLTPHSYHLILCDRDDRYIRRDMQSDARRDTRKGRRAFMHKLCTAYAMYYKHIHAHQGGLFTHTYTTQDIPGARDALQRAISDIHQLPAHFSTNSDTIKSVDPLLYSYSSFKEYRGFNRPQHTLLAEDYTELCIGGLVTEI